MLTFLSAYNDYNDYNYNHYNDYNYNQYNYNDFNYNDYNDCSPSCPLEEAALDFPRALHVRQVCQPRTTVLKIITLLITNVEM